MKPSLALVVVATLSAPVFATSYAAPVRHDVYSPNEQFVLDVNPATEVHTVYVESDRGTPLWSFSKPVWHSPFLLSNDGKVVVTFAWRHIKEEHLATAECVQFWNAKGQFKSFAFSELCPHPAPTSAVGVGPIGDFWRTWYTELKQEGDHFHVSTTDRYAYTFSMTKASVEEKRLEFSTYRYKPWFYITILILVIGAFVISIALVGWMRRSASIPSPR